MNKHTYPSALMLVAVVLPLPFFATLITVAFYIILPPQWLDFNWAILLLGLIFSIVVWLVSAFFIRNFTTAKNAHKSSYNSIMQELWRLDANYDIASTNKARAIADAKTGSLQKTFFALKGESPDESESIKSTLESNGPQWIQSTGYIDIWNRLQTADQEMIMLLPNELVKEDADYDLMRLDGSTIPNNQQWMDTITTAKATLDKSDNHKKMQLAHQNNPTTIVAASSADEQQLLLGQALLDLLTVASTSSTLPLDEADIPLSFGQAFLSIIKNAVSPSSTPPPEESEEQARADLRRARIAINTYVTNRWTSLVQSRNRLYGTTFFASVFIYLLFATAMFAKAPQSSLIAAIIFYFVGAIIGVFGYLVPKPNASNKSTQTSSQSSSTKKSPHTSRHASASSKSTSQGGSASSNASANSNAPTDDYGLTIARILVTPIISGLAALIGVGLATMLSITLATLTPGPSNIGTPTPSSAVTVTANTSAALPTPITTTSASTFLPVPTVTAGALTSTPTVNATTTANAAATASTLAATPTAIAAVSTPTPVAAAPQGNRSIPNYPSLDQVYNLSDNVQGVIFAMIFGFLPGLVISGLQKEATALQSQLQSTAPGEQDSSS